MTKMMKVGLYLVSLFDIKDGISFTWHLLHELITLRREVGLDIVPLSINIGALGTFPCLQFSVESGYAGSWVGVKASCLLQGTLQMIWGTCYILGNLFHLIKFYCFLFEHFCAVLLCALSLLCFCPFQPLLKIQPLFSSPLTF